MHLGERNWAKSTLLWCACMGSNRGNHPRIRLQVFHKKMTCFPEIFMFKYSSSWLNTHIFNDFLMFNVLLAACVCAHVRARVCLCARAYFSK